jgi:hypothetical protein
VWHSWVDVTLDELNAFIGVIINITLNLKTHLLDYFSEAWLDRMPFFKENFSSAVFKIILGAASYSSCGNTGCFHPQGSKLKNVSDYINSKCKVYHVLGEHVSIDEGTVGFRGRVQWKCYNSEKLTNWGLCIYCLCDSTNGYIFCHGPNYGRFTTDSLLHPDVLFISQIRIHLVLMSKAGIIRGCFTCYWPASSVTTY